MPPALLSFLVIAVIALGFCQSAGGQTFTVVNKCSYTVYAGIYPPVYENGGLAMAPGASVSFAPGNKFIGRIWGRIGCNAANPARCSTGQCGGTGLQCAGTTGQLGTSLAEFTLDASGTDWYDVSYVDGMDNPIGIQVSNGSCVSPSACSSAPLTNCPSELGSGNYCLSPCSEFNTDQFCCRNAFGTPATCVVSQWPAADQAYVNNIHASCPNQYAYAYDDNVGLHTCPTGSNYTITFCPGGSEGGGFINVAGLASDVGVGADGSVWVTSGGAIYRYVGGNFVSIPGLASRVAVDPNGNAWVVNSGGLIYRYTGSGFVNVPGLASDVGIGADGTIWVTNPIGLIYRYNGTSFQPIPGLASRIAVDPSGNAWVVNPVGLIYRYTGSSFVNVPGLASDVGVGADGTVWVTNPGGLIYRYNGTSFDQLAGRASQISVDPVGQPWVVNSAGFIYRYFY